MSADFSINPQAQVQLMHLGQEREPLLMIDNLFRDPHSVVSYAADAVTYGPAGAAYPGLRAPVPNDYNVWLYEALLPLLHGQFGIAAQMNLVLTSSFSMITNRADTLKHLQRVPHVDQHGPHNLAMVHYLCEPDFGGTSFFRHRATGFETVTEERRAEHDSTLNREMNSRVVPARFPDAEHPFYDLIYTVPAAFNRLVLYRACILHSPGIRQEARFPSDPRTGRLTITGFLNPIEDFSRQIQRFN